MKVYVIVKVLCSSVLGICHFGFLQLSAVDVAREATGVFRTYFNNQYIFQQMRFMIQFT
jgi:hypothetical protein